ncbi:MAG: hypothetical protein ACLQIH_00315 [Myxococcaceae bacterium]
MRTRKVIYLSLISAGAAFLFSACPAQPPGPCVIAHTAGGGFGNGTPYVAYYYLNSDAGFAPSAACANADFAYWPLGDFVGQIYVESYGYVTENLKLTAMVPDEFSYTTPFTGDYVQGSPNSTPPVANSPLVLGNFTTDVVSAQGTCVIVMDGGPGTQVIAEPAGNQTVQYSYPTATVYSTPAAGAGTQMEASAIITRTDATTGDVCTRNYNLLALWPTAVCQVDNDCNPNPQPSNSPPRPLGSGVLPGIPTNCNATMVTMAPVMVDTSSSCSPSPYILATTSNGCGGGSINNNSIAAFDGVCFFQNFSPTTFPYVTPGFGQ